MDSATPSLIATYMAESLLIGHIVSVELSDHQKSLSNGNTQQQEVKNDDDREPFVLRKKDLINNHSIPQDAKSRQGYPNTFCHFSHAFSSTASRSEMIERDEPQGKLR